MSNREKQFITVVGSKHKKPKAMFLANNESPAPWAYHAKYALILPLERVLAHCKWLSIPEEGIYLIDAENLDSFTDGFTDIKIKLSTFIMMCANTNRQIIRYLRKDIIPPIVAPSERQLADDALREIAIQLHNQPTIYNTKDKPAVMLPDGERDDDADYIYLLYTLTADNQITYYRSENPRQTIRRKKQLAEVFTKAEAQAKTMFPDENGCMWHVEKVNRNAAKDDDAPEVIPAYGGRDSEGRRPLPKHLEGLYVIYYEIDAAKTNDIEFYNTHSQCIRVTIDGKFANLFDAEHAKEFIDILRQDMPGKFWRFQKAGEMKARLEATNSIAKTLIESKPATQQAEPDDTKVITLPKEEERREKLVLTNCNGEFLVDKESLLFSRFVNKAVLFDSKQQIDEFLVEKGASGEFRFNTLLIADAEMVIAEGSRYSWALFEKALIPLSLPEHELAPHLFE